MAMPNPSQPQLPDFYNVLGVDLNATDQEVRRAFFQKARQVHPDKDTGTKIEDWHLLHKAYSTLTDNIQRRDYNEKLASADVEGEADYTRLTLPTTVRFSDKFKQAYDQWLRFDGVSGNFSKALCEGLKKMFTKRCKPIQANKKMVDRRRKRKIELDHNFEDMMNSIAGTVKLPTSSSLLQEVTENLVRIIRAAQMSKTVSETTGNRVPILDLSTSPVNDLFLLFQLFNETDHTQPVSNFNSKDLQRCVMKYVPLTDVQAGMLKQVVKDRKCGKCSKRVSSSSFECVSCEKRFCKKCSITSIKAPRIGINIPKPICQDCITKLSQKDAEDWITKAQQLVHNGTANTHRAVMGCVLMAIHTSETLPLSQLRGLANGLVNKGFHEQALLILSVLQKETDLNRNVKIYLPAVKALQGISKKPGKSWKEKWLLTLTAQQATLLAAESLILSNSSIDVPDLDRTREEIVTSVTDIEHEKEMQYNSLIKTSLRELEKAWEIRDISQMLIIATSSEVLNDEALILSNGVEPALKALEQFLEAKRGYMSRMMPDDQCALQFFQGFSDICNGQGRQGLECIERAVWSGHHNKWLSEVAIPIIVAHLEEHPSVQGDILIVGREILQNSLPSHQLNFNSLLHALGITQEDLNPTLKSCWPVLTVAGINQGATKKYEKTVFQQVQDGRLDYTEAGYALLDFIPSACHPAEIVVAFLNASLWFLKDLRTKKSVTSQQIYATKKITIRCVINANVASLQCLHPGMQFYVARLGLTIVAEAIVAAGKCATEDDTEVFVELLHTVIQKGRFCPFWKMPIIPICEAVLLNILSGRMHTEFMLELQKDLSNDLVSDAEVKYQLYENDLRWTCPVEDKDATRARAMESLLKTKGLSWSDISDSMCSPLNPRTPDGWLLQQENLGGDLQFAQLRGFEFDIDSDSPSIKLTAVPTGHGAKGLFSTADVHTVLQIPTKELFPILFSLDPPDETQHFHPFQQLRFVPSSLERTDLLHTLLTTDYLMKCFSVGSDVSAQPPFIQRDCSENLTANLPPRLKKVLAPVSERGSCSNKMSRFWIQADEIEYNITQDGSHIKCQIGAVKMVIRTQPQIPGLDGKLHDAEDEDPDSPESKFAKDLTDNYDEISKYFPMFGRLRELCKLQILGVILGGVIEDMVDKASGKGIKIPPQVLQEIQTRARRENESRIQNMLAEIKEKVGVWPAADDSATVSNFAQVIRAQVQSQYGSRAVTYDVECEINRKVKEMLREKDQSCINQLTKDITEMLSGRSYRGNVRRCVNSWLSHGSRDLLNLLLSSMPVPTERDLLDAFTAESKKRLNAFKCMVQNISTSGIHVPRRTCTWVPAAVKVEDKGDSMRMCYGGVFLAPTLKETKSIPQGRGQRNYDLNRLRSSRSENSPIHFAPFNTPVGLTTPKNRDIDGSSAPRNFLTCLEPIHLHSKTLVVIEVSMQATHTNITTFLTNILASAGRGSHGRRGGSGARGGGIRSQGHGGGSGDGGHKRSGGDGGRKGGGGDGKDGGDGDGCGRGIRSIMTELAFSIGFFQQNYDTERKKVEKVIREHIPEASDEAKCRTNLMIPNTDVLRMPYSQTKFREKARKDGTDVSGRHAAHIVSLDVVRYILINVDGKDLTKDELEKVKVCSNQPSNLEMALAKTNQSDHIKKDNAWVKAMTEYFKQGCVTEVTWDAMDLKRVKEAVTVLKRKEWPPAISQRVQVLRQIVNPRNPTENLWDI